MNLYIVFKRLNFYIILLVISKSNQNRFGRFKIWRLSIVVGLHKRIFVLTIKNINIRKYIRQSFVSNILNYLNITKFYRRWKTTFWIFLVMVDLRDTLYAVQKIYAARKFKWHARNFENDWSCFSINLIDFFRESQLVLH